MGKLKEDFKYFWKAHITNWFWKDSRERRRIRNMAFGDRKLDYLSKYIPFIINLQLPENKEITENEEEKAYTLWLQGKENAPEIVKQCLQSLQWHLGDNLIVLNQSSIYDYIDLPEEIKLKWENNEMRGAHFADIVRIELLYRYGGYWFDATDFMFQPIPEYIKKTDFFMYVSSRYKLPHTCVQNYFIRAKKGDPLLGMWRALVLEYWKHEKTAITYFLVQLLFRVLITYNGDAKALYEKMPKVENDYPELLWDEIGNMPFNDSLFKKMAEKSFFQKCSYRKNVGVVKELLPGSMAEMFFDKYNSIFATQR